MLLEKGTTEDEMVGQCHRSDEHEFNPTPGGSGGQEGLECSGPRGHEESDMTKRLNNNITTKELFTNWIQSGLSLTQPSILARSVN